MASFVITGGKNLSGEIVPQGAKNEALQIICACLLTDERVVIHNVPDIEDIRNLLILVEAMGSIVERDKNTIAITARDLKVDFFTSDRYHQLTSSLRGSVMIAGPLLTRLGFARIPRPGGDKIGRRRLDTHFIGFEKLGAKIGYSTNADIVTVEVKDRLKGTFMLLDEASVTGTANIIMAAVKAEGITTIYNAACEPYIQQLCQMLISMGARIDGVGSNLIRIEGVERLHGTTHNVLPDMIEVGSFIGLAAMTQSELRIKNVSVPNLGIIPDVFRRLGIAVVQENDDLLVPRQEVYEVETFLDGSIMTIADAPWPGFTPDLLSVALVVATQAKGSVLIHQKMFESRLFFVDKLIDMGAQIILCDPHRATVIGLERKVPLRGIKMSSPDIRAGVSLLIAALSARGNSVISNIEQIDRGYERIDERLNNLGAEIKRIKKVV